MNNPSHTRRRCEGGYATAEAALVVPSLMLLLAVALAVVTTVGAQLKCVDAAREAARVAVRGDDDAAITRAVHELGPQAARLQVVRHGRWVDVTVRAVVRPLGFLPGFPLRAEASGELESAR